MEDNRNDKGQVIDFNKVRTAKIEEKRRRFERVMFKSMLGAYCVAEKEGQADSLRAVELIDLSKEGLSFQLPANSKNTDSFSVGQSVIFRVYFTEDTFLLVSVKIVNSKSTIEEHQHHIRFGCVVDKTLFSYDAYSFFVSFLSKYAEGAQTDSGELKLHYF